MALLWVWVRSCDVRLSSGPCSKRQTLLVSYAALRRMDLRALCESQPLRRSDGTAGSHPAGHLTLSLRHSFSKSASRGSGGRDGYYYFFVRFSRRNACPGRPDGGSCISADSAPEGTEDSAGAGFLPDIGGGVVNLARRRCIDCPAVKP